MPCAYLRVSSTRSDVALPKRFEDTVSDLQHMAAGLKKPAQVLWRGARRAAKAHAAEWAESKIASGLEKLASAARESVEDTPEASSWKSLGGKGFALTDLGVSLVLPTAQSMVHRVPGPRGQVIWAACPQPTPLGLHVNTSDAAREASTTTPARRHAPGRCCDEPSVPQITRSSCQLRHRCSLDQQQQQQ